MYKEKPVKKDHDFTFEQMQEMPYAKINLSGKEERRPYHPKKVWEFDLADLMGKCESLTGVDPLIYFRTTGEAIIKMRKLEADLFAAAGLARKIGNVLNKLKGDNIYLETTWLDGRLLIKAKNPRKNKEEKALALKENFEHGKKLITPNITDS
jgi:hypothetical protein